VPGREGGCNVFQSVKLFSTSDTEFMTIEMDVTGFVTFIGVDLHKCTVTLSAVRADG
jgi:hypothetical protein